MSYTFFVLTVKYMSTRPAIAGPTNLQAGSNNPGTVDLNRTDNSENETGFRIQRKDSTDIFTDAGTVNAGITSYTDNVPNITTYIFRVVAYNNTAVSDYSNEAEIIITQVPVELISFFADVSGNKVTLKWSTTSEQNNKGFSIERSFGDNWASIAFIQGHGITNEKNYYSYSDDFTNNNYRGIVKYRLKQIDYDGSFQYSAAVTVNVDINSLGYYLDQNYPNPFNPVTKIHFNIPERSKVNLWIINLLGKVVEELTKGELKEGSYEKVWNASGFASGVYLIILKAVSDISNKTYFKVLKMLYLK